MLPNSRILNIVFCSFCNYCCKITFLYFNINNEKLTMINACDLYKEFI